MKFRQLMLIPLIALLLFIPVINAQAEDEPPPPQYDEMDNDFINALVVMSVNHDILAGNNELGELNALNAIVGEFYDRKIKSPSIGAEERDALNMLRNKHITMINNKIVSVRRGAAKNWMITLFDFFTDLGYMKTWDPNPSVDEYDSLPRPLAEDDNLPDTTERLENTVIWTDFGKTVNGFFTIAMISAMPSIAPSLSDSSGWSYTTPEISNSIPTIGNSDSSASGENGSSPSPGDSAPPVNPSGGNSDAQDEPRLKPIRFDNNGFEPVTVIVESYEPASGLSSYVPNTSTVVNPDSNSSAYLNLPLGTYTFCYYWRLDQDYDNDDYFDYHHRSTGTYTLTVNSSNNVTGATTVTLSPDSIVSNPNGKCGENRAQDNSDLTPEERANQGTFTYASTCHDADWCDNEVDYDVITISFSNGTVLFESGGNIGEAARTGTNTYTKVTGDQYGTVYTYVFTREGFQTTSNIVDGRLVFIRQD